MRYVPGCVYVHVYIYEFSQHGDTIFSLFIHIKYSCCGMTTHKYLVSVFCCNESKKYKKIHLGKNQFSVE